VPRDAQSNERYCGNLIRFGSVPSDKFRSVSDLRQLSNRIGYKQEAEIIYHKYLPKKDEGSEEIHL